MLDLGTLLIKIKADGIKDVKKSLEEIKSGASKSADGVESRFGALGGKIGKLMKGAAIAGVAALGAATLKIGKDALKAYSDYEQLSGGVQKIFGKDTAKIVEQNAQNAFKTAGLSANEYMEQVTNFSATLIKDLGGDTEKAAKYADMAIVNMSDNANTFGTDIQSLQNAYQGFAKGNATMLDNLKVGYGGTKKEMLQLAKDMGVVDDKVKSFDDMSFPQAIEAIDKLQKKLNISGYDMDELNAKLKDMSLSEEEVAKVAEDMGVSTSEVYKKMKDGTLTAKDAQVLLGTTAREAATTIEGSTKMLKSSWDNMMLAIGTGDSEKIKKAISDLGNSIVIFLQNIVPRIGTIAAGIGKALVSVFTSIDWGAVGTKVLSKITQFLSFIGGKLPSFIPAIIQKLLSALEAITSGEGSNKMQSTGIKLIKGIVVGIGKAIPLILKALPKILLAILNAAGSWLGKLVEMGVNLVKALASGLVNSVASALAPFKAKIAAVFNAIKFVITSYIKGYLFVITTVFNAIKKVITTVVNAIKTTISKVFNTIKTIVTTVFNKIKSTASSIWNSIKSTIKGRVDSIKNTVSSVFNSLKSKVQSVWNAIKTAITKPINAAKDAVKKAIDKIKGFFDFKVSLPKIKLPHFSISPAGWKLGDLLKGSIPSLGISWYKDGGFFNGPHVLSGLGEGGPEYALPLNQRSLAPLASMLNTLMIKEKNKIAEQPIIVNTDLYVDGKKIATTTAPYIRQEIKKIDMSINRQKGLL